jgi:predicted metal-dependent hydrolase
MQPQLLDITTDTIDYNLIRSRRRTLSLMVSTDGQIIVRSPMRMSQAKIDAFIRSKRNWLEKTLVEVATRSVYKTEIAKQQKSGKQCLFGKWQPITNKKELESIQTKFEIVVLQLLNQTITKYDQNLTDIDLDIKFANYKSRWGACKRAKTRSGRLPKKATLMFNKKLIYLPIALVNYVVVHETAHLFEPNHSSKFWDKVAELLPNYKDLRKEIKQYNIL